MRALWSLVVVCLVAATSVRPALAQDQRAAVSVQRKLIAVHARPTVQSAPRRATSNVSGAPDVVAVVVAAWAQAPARVAVPVAWEAGRSVVAVRSLATRSARGPPIV